MLILDKRSDDIIKGNRKGITDLAQIVAPSVSAFTDVFMSVKNVTIIKSAKAACIYKLVLFIDIGFILPFHGIFFIKQYVYRSGKNANQK